METVRALLSVAANENMFLSQIDVTTAFLYGNINEDIYMHQPEGYNDGSGMVCKLKRSLYGLKQAPRCWNQRFKDHLLKLRFKQCESDSCLFIRKRGENKIFLALYVDDGLIAASDKTEMEQLIMDIKKEFKIISKKASYYLGLEIKQETNGSIKITQKGYIQKLLERFGMENCRTVSTPILKDSEENTDDKIEDKCENFPYRQAVGALIYLMSGTRPDINYAVSYASRSLENPTSKDVIKVKRIFRYLRGTITYGIEYKVNSKPGILQTYSDADHGGDKLTGRSTSGAVCIFAGGAVSWFSRRQQSVAISTTEAELVAASEAARELLWLKRLFRELTTLKCIPTLQVDNEAAVRLAMNPEFHHRTKHIRIRHFFVREMVIRKEIFIQRTSTEDQLADLMTKPLHSPRIKKLIDCLGIIKLLNEGEC